MSRKINRNKYDIVITGSGFAGAIAALVLRKCGMRVCLIEKGSHPRFTIGESSTPAADMILRSLAQRYELPVLNQLSRYGSWQEHHPEILCGLKRGFSYFLHEPEALFQTDLNHSLELLVAASSSDKNSDTQWFRPDVDAFLVGECIKAGVDYRELTQVRSVRRGSGNNLELKLETGNFKRTEPSGSDGWRKKTAGSKTGRSSTTPIECRWLIDASGSPGQASRLFGSKVTTDGFKTHSHALFSHFFGVQRWSDHLKNLGVPCNDYPFDPDHSALHHWLREGWMWNLRFDNGRVSAGFVIDTNDPPGTSGTALLPGISTDSPPEKVWEELIGRYPSLAHCFRNSVKAPQPGRIVRTGRLQRRMQPLYGNHWIALNHTAGFVDPLHSTGIAHSLSGLERILDLLTGTRIRSEALQEGLAAHQDSYLRELELIDLLVASCYKSRWSPPLFQAAVMLYFICTLLYERRRLSGAAPGSFLCADHGSLFRTVSETFSELSNIARNRDPAKAEILSQRIMERIKSFDPSGILDTKRKNMYHHTAVSL